MYSNESDEFDNVTSVFPLTVLVNGKLIIVGLSPDLLRASKDKKTPFGCLPSFPPVKKRIFILLLAGVN